MTTLEKKAAEIYDCFFEITESNILAKKCALKSVMMCREEVLDFDTNSKFYWDRIFEIIEKTK